MFEILCCILIVLVVITGFFRFLLWYRVEQLRNGFRPELKDVVNLERYRANYRRDDGAKGIESQSISKSTYSGPIGFGVSGVSWEQGRSGKMKVQGRQANWIKNIRPKKGK